MDARREGYDAFDRNETPDDCPYSYGSPEYDAWISGWDDGYEEYLTRHRPHYPDVDFIIKAIFTVFLLLAVIVTGAAIWTG